MGERPAEAPHSRRKPQATQSPTGGQCSKGWKFMSLAADSRAEPELRHAPPSRRPGTFSKRAIIVVRRTHLRTSTVRRSAEVPVALRIRSRRSALPAQRFKQLERVARRMLRAR